MVAKLSTRRYSLRQINNFLCYFCNHRLHYDLHKTVMKLLIDKCFRSYMVMNKRNIIVITLFAVIVFLFLILFFRWKVIIFVDLSSGRMKSETQAFGITIDVTEYESKLTEMTKDLNIEYDVPRWKVISAFQKNIFGKIWLGNVLRAARSELKSTTLQQFFPYATSPTTTDAKRRWHLFTG